MVNVRLVRLALNGVGIKNKLVRPEPGEPVDPMFELPNFPGRGVQVARGYCVVTNSGEDEDGPWFSEGRECSSVAQLMAELRRAGILFAPRPAAR